MKPIILITCSGKDEDFCLRQAYCHEIAQAGGIPLILPSTEIFADELQLKADALLLSGGGDADPQFYGEEKCSLCALPDKIRDNFELQAIKAFYDAQKPILGICRGMQMLNIFFGGDLYQDLSQKQGEVLLHNQAEAKNIPTHEVFLRGKMKDFWARESIKVNSFHHQGVKNLGQKLCEGAFCKDGLCEGFYTQDGFIWGVQWHPEALHDNNAKALFRAFILASGGK